LQSRSQELGKSWTWINIGKQYRNLFKQVLDNNYGSEEHNLSYGGL
jgi:hypothetical protein